MINYIFNGLSTEKADIIITISFYIQNNIINYARWKTSFHWSFDIWNLILRIYT